MRKVTAPFTLNVVKSKILRASQDKDPSLTLRMTILRQGYNLAVVTILRIAEQLQLLNHKLSISESNSE
ncbi:MAG TPA: hypothetical protein GX004_08270 [Firmicutes bacterium]|nr:hypothetical protein [Bacillota bacterium]